VTHTTKKRITSSQLVAEGDVNINLSLYSVPETRSEFTITEGSKDKKR